MMVPMPTFRNGLAAYAHPAIIRVVKETKRAPAYESVSPGDRHPSRKRYRPQNAARSVLEIMRETADPKPYYPRTPSLRQGCDTLKANGLVEEKEDGGFIFTDVGRETAYGRKMGRPTKLTGPWLMLVSHYGGVESFADLVPCASHTVNRWALHGVKPNRVMRKVVSELAEKAKVPNPFEEAS